MKVFGFIAFLSVANAGGIISYLAPTYNSAVVHNARINNGFAYNTVQSHAYVPSPQPQVYYYYTYPTYSYDFAPVQPSYPQPSYPGVSIPSIPTYTPSYPGNFIPTYPSGIPNYPQNPNRPPIEVEDPADNAPADIVQQGGNNNNNNVDDDDTVTIESL